MLQLTPFKETESFREAMHEDRVELLIKHIRRKFHFTEGTLEKLTVHLRQIPLEDLADLFEDILDINTLKELNAWLDERLPEMNGQSSI